MSRIVVAFLTIVLFAASSFTVNAAQFGTRDEAVATSQKLAPPGAAAALSPEPRRCVIFKACCGARRARGTEKLIPSQTVCMTGPLEEEELS